MSDSKTEKSDKGNISVFVMSVVVGDNDAIESDRDRYDDEDENLEDLVHHEESLDEEEQVDEEEVDIVGSFGFSQKK